MTFPRHMKGYLWIVFLVFVFVLMALSENGVFSTDKLIPNPRYELRSTLKTHGGFRSPGGLQDRLQESHSEANEAEEQEETGPAPSTYTAEVNRPKEEPTSTASKPSSKANPEQTFNGLSPNDVVILVKTGATSIWRRMPIHLSTTLSCPLLTPNIIIYSDAPDSLPSNNARYTSNHARYGSLPVIDVLANVSSTLQNSKDFELYRKAKDVRKNNLYLESGSMEGDTYLPGGWRLDKYKFLPMFQHAAREYAGRGVKWFVYMEDDNYFFWPQLYSWLGTLDHNAPMLVGSPAFRLGEDFAHGGSGFAISGAAMDISFGSHEGLAETYESYAAEQCCGDQVLSHVLREKGVERYKDLDGGGWAALQSLPTWRIGFGAWNWCSSLMNVHKVHQADVSYLHTFERKFMTEIGVDARIRYSDLYMAFAKENIFDGKGEKSEWDNYADAKSFASSYDEDVKVAGKKGLRLEELRTKPWYSKSACKKACEDWDQCLSWKYADDNCGLGHTFSMGQRIDEGIRMESGWMLDRIRKLENATCEPLDF